MFAVKREPLLIDEHEVMRRAYEAYFRRNGAQADQPNSALSDVREHKGRAYVALENINGVLAVYRIKNDGALKHLKRWPRAILA